MRRTVIFVTLISLLIVVAGVSAAQDGVFSSGQLETTAPEPTAPEPSVEQPSEPTTQQGRSDEQEGIGIERPENKGEYDGGEKGENGPSEPEDDGRGNERGEEPGKGHPGGSGDENEEREGSGGEKVTVCHKGKTLSVGAPAEPAHLGHGDDSGPC